MLAGQGGASTSSKTIVALVVLEWKWEMISMDFTIGITHDG